MKNLKVIKIYDESIEFDGGITMYSDHQQDCCEHHYLSFADLTLEDFDGLEFDLTTDSFFERIDGYGIALNPINGFPIRVAGYGYNNGYYGTNLDLIVEDKNGNKKIYNISECQNILD